MADIKLCPEGMGWVVEHLALDLGSVLLLVEKMEMLKSAEVAAKGLLKTSGGGEEDGV